MPYPPSRRLGRGGFTFWSRALSASWPSPQYSGQSAWLMWCSGMRSCLASTASGLPSMPVMMLPPRSAAPSKPCACTGAQRRMTRMRRLLS